METRKDTLIEVRGKVMSLITPVLDYISRHAKDRGSLTDAGLEYASYTGEMNALDNIKKYLNEEIDSFLTEKWKREKNIEREHNKNWYAIKEDCKEIVGRYSKEHGRTRTSYILGAIDTMDDYFWVSMDEDGNLIFDSCVGTPDILPESNITVMEDGKMVHTHTKFMERLSDEERKKKIERAYNKVLTEIRYSGFECSKLYGMRNSNNPQWNNEIANRVLHPEEYILYWITDKENK